MTNEPGPQTAAIFYHPEGFDTSRAKLMGRHAAGESFLQAFSHYAASHRLYCYSDSKAHAEDMFRRVQSYGSKKEVAWVPSTQPERLEGPGALFLPGPNLDVTAWQRRFYRQRAYSLCGITHTTSSDRTMDSIGQWLVAPTQPWDAVICTSNAVKGHVETLLANHGEYLASRLGLKEPVRTSIQLPVIPLGINCAAFDPPQKADLRRQWREQLQIADDAVAFLFMGRLSYHAKAHPYPMYVALERVAQRTGKSIHLLMAGWFANDALARQFKEGAETFCPSVKVHFLDGRKPEVRHTIWFAADVHTSLSDNIQETFGITPIEAMAAGLPNVVTDWNGYKESIRDGVDGFRIATMLPPGGSGLDLAYRHMAEHDDYDRYIGQVSQCTSVDIDACTEAYKQLATDPELRLRMGQAAQAEARRRFDWQVIVPAYEALWSELAAIRGNEDIAENAPRGDGAVPPHPLRDDPYRMFAHYPSRTLSPDTPLTLSTLQAEQITAARAAKMNDLGRGTVMPAGAVNQIIEHIAANPGVTANNLAQALKVRPEAGAIFLRTLVWLHKLGVVVCE